MLRFLIGLMLWLAISGGSTFAQDSPDLTVTLKDISNTPLAGAMVIIRDGSGSHDLARATTNAQGVATFSGLMETDIRVVIQGQLPNGAKFFQPGNDAKGIAMFLSVGANRMNLLADTDGMIAPDPLTMSALEPGIPVATAEETTFPTAPLVQPSPTVTAIAAATRPTVWPQLGTANIAAAPVAEENAPAVEQNLPASTISIWLGLALLALLLCAGIGIIALQRRWR